MKDKILYVWFQLAVGICNRLAVEVLSRFESIVDLYNCNDFSFLGEKREKYITRLENKGTSEAFEVLKRCQALGVEITGFYDDLYPSRLRKIEIPPAVLYSIGTFRNLNNYPCVAIVGTRKMTDYGQYAAETFGYEIAKSGAYVVSGLARGIDVSAHRGAIRADGYTIGVLGNPIGDVYPRENKKAFETLYERGLVLSELYPGCPRTKGDFPNRNRIISALSDSIVIAEAGEGSGSLITAKHGIAQGKRIYAIPGAIGGANTGTNQLIKQGIAAATEASDVLGPLMLEYPEVLSCYEPAVTKKLHSYGNAPLAKTPTQKPNAVEKEKTKKPVFTGDKSKYIYEILKDSHPLTADEISADSGLSVSEVLSELTMMEIEGIITVSAGGRYQTSKI